jgi:cytochrome c oxidase subunit 3
MSTVSTIPTAHDDAHGHGDGNGHDPHLAHHFDSIEQQTASGKLGMWVFLATEILMFGGLFCAYSVYRHNHPDVFEYAHKYLDKSLGAINTVVLITSSLTMAWGVRLAQLGKQRGLIICLALTLLGGFGFMAIKSIEYKSKWEHHLGFAQANRYDLRNKPLEAAAAGQHQAIDQKAAANQQTTHAAKQVQAGGAAGSAAPANAGSETHAGGNAPGAPKAGDEAHRAAAAQSGAGPVNPEFFDPHSGTPDATAVRPIAQAPAGLAPQIVAEHHAAGHHDQAELDREFGRLSTLDKQRTSTFFQVYFMMTGLHGIHVVIGMALIFWILVKAVPPATRRSVNMIGLASIGLFFLYVGILILHRPSLVIGIVILLLAGAGLFLWALRPTPVPAGALAGGGTAVVMGAGATAAVGDFGPHYFQPVDIVGLYWHLVDLIWIFLFPLLYLI